VAAFDKTWHFLIKLISF